MQDLLAAQRRQTVADSLRRQETDATAAELADPAALLVRWVEGGHIDWTAADTVIPEVSRIADAFARPRREHERSVEFEALAVLREFLTSFPEISQKRMLYTLLAAGMNSAERPQHAAKVHSLLNGHAPADTASTE